MPAKSLRALEMVGKIMSFYGDVIFGVKLFLEAVVGLIVAGFITSTIRTLFGRPSQSWTIESAMNQAAKEGWLHRSLCAFDICVNVILIRGQQDETISTHSWRAAQEGKIWGKYMCWWLNLFQKDHGPQAAAGDLERALVRVVVLKKALGING